MGMSSNDADIAKLYRRVVEHAPQGALLVELGVWSGTSLAAMAQAAKDLRRDDLRIVGVDLWEGSKGEPDLQAEAAKRDVYGECVARLRSAGLLDRVALLRCDSVKAAGLFGGQTVHFVFHDSCHEEDHLVEEIVAWRSRLVGNCVQAGHDIGRPGVANAVKRCLGSMWGVDGSCWVGVEE